MAGDLSGSGSQDQSSPPAASSRVARSIAPLGVRVSQVTIVAPVPQWSIPLAVPITVPRFVQRRLQKGQAMEPKELVRDVNLEVQPGEMLAM